MTSLNMTNAENKCIAMLNVTWLDAILNVNNTEITGIAMYMLPDLSTMKSG